MGLRHGLVALAAAAAAAAYVMRDRPIPAGFTAASATVHLRVEREFLSQPDPSRLREIHRRLTSEPHPTGSARNRELAGWIADEFRDAGLTVQLASHDVLLPEPLEVLVELTHPHAWRAPMQEPPRPHHEPGASEGRNGTAEIPHHAYSASGDVAGPVVYAGDGLPQDYEWLSARGIDVRGAIVIARHSRHYSYRGYKAFVAEQRGAVGLLLFSDPAFDGSAAGAPYPAGPARPDHAIQRGSIVYDFFAPGDPLTPGWASLPGAKRLGREEAWTLPGIVSAPLSAADAVPILEAVGGSAAPAGWQGGLPLSYRIGPGPARVRLRVRSREGLQPVHTVIGLFEGQETPEQVLIVGNHRDAWQQGGGDPGSGTAVLVELARSLGSLARGGWRPRRSILLASWDGEELALLSSTEWGEQHAAWLRERAVAYLNVDAAATGSRFVAAAVPSLTTVIADAAAAVRDPDGGGSIAAGARARWSAERGVAAHDADTRFVDPRPGGGSDYSVFLHHLGIPIADLAFDGPHGVYHSAYDTHEWIARFGDPGFHYHAALTKIVGLITLRLAEGDALLLDPSATASRLSEFSRDFERRLQAGGLTRHRAELETIREACAALVLRASAFDEARTLALQQNDRPALDRLNRRALGFERAFLDPAGLPSRPWYRHLVHAPAFSYEPLIFPGLEAALDSDAGDQFAEEAARLAAAVRRAAAQLDPH